MEIRRNTRLINSEASSKQPLRQRQKRQNINYQRYNWAFSRLYERRTQNTTTVTDCNAHDSIAGASSNFRFYDATIAVDIANGENMFGRAVDQTYSQNVAGKRREI